MLLERMEKFKVVNSVGMDIGKIRDVYLKMGDWKISGLKLSPGPLKKSLMVDIKDIIDIDVDASCVRIKDDFKQMDVPEGTTTNHFPYSELRKRPVVDKKGEKVGKIYDLEIPLKEMHTEKVWKVLVRTGFKDRRLRLSTDEVDGVKDEISLKKELDEYT